MEAFRARYRIDPAIEDREVGKQEDLLVLGRKVFECG